MKKISLILLIYIIFLTSNIFPLSRKEIVSSLFRCVEKWMGSPYKLGGNNKDGIDCSGFVQNVYNEVFKIKIPRTVNKIKSCGIAIEDKLQPGDLLFFNINGNIDHIGIYVFNNKFIHSASAGSPSGVTKSSLNEKYYKNRFVFAKRIINLPKFFPDNSINNPQNTIGEIIVGRLFFRKKIIDQTKTFNSDSPIFLELQINSPKEKNYYFKIIHIDKKTEVIKQNISLTKRNLKKMTLPKGQYIISIFENNIKIKEKEIFVN